MERHCHAVHLTPAAFEAIMTFSQPTVRAVIARPLHPVIEDSHDRCQEVYIAAWRRAKSLSSPFVALDEQENARLERIASFNEIPLAIRKWLCKAAVNQAGTELRARKIRAKWCVPLLLEHEQTPERNALGLPRLFPDETPDMFYQDDQLEAEMLNLSPLTRACLILHHAHDLTAAEVAELLSMDVQAVKKRLYRAKTALRQARQAASEARARQGDQR